MDSRQKTYPKLRVFPRCTRSSAHHGRACCERSRARRNLDWAGRTVRRFPSSRSSRGTRFQGPTSTTSSSPRTALFNSPVYRSSGRRTRARPPTRRSRTARTGGACRRWTPTATRRRGRRRARSRSSGPTRPALTSPDDGATISFPAEPLVLRWDPVPGAAKYSVEIASDEDLSSLVTSGGNPVVIQATNLAPAILLSSNTYYWAVTPLDAQGNPGEQSEIRSFTWEWPSTTTPVVEDIADETELYDPEVLLGSCARRGALRGRGQLLVRLLVRVKGLLRRQADRHDTDPEGGLREQHVLLARPSDQRAQPRDAGGWNVGPVLRRRPSTTTRSSTRTRSRTSGCAIPSIRERTRDSGTPGYQTELPIVTWDPVPGASSYQVNVVPFTI